MDMPTNELPLVSIIIPTYNRAWIISETLDSILRLTYQNWECIIVDDGSTDNTEEVVLKYVQKDSRFRFYFRPDKYKPGANGARNYGFDISKGEFIQWFDSDDIVLEDFLSDKVDIFIKHPEYQSLTSRHTYFEKDDKILDDQLQWTGHNEANFENMITCQMPIMPHDIIFRKHFLLSINERYDESLKYQDEYEFYARIFVKHPHKTLFIDKSFALVRRNNEDSVSTVFHAGKSLKMNQSALLAQIKLTDLLLQNDKLTHGIFIYNYRFQKEMLTIAVKNKHDTLAKDYKNLIERVLIYRNDKFDLAKFRLGYRMLRIMPIDNLFLNYNHHPAIYLFNRFISGNIKRIYKLLFVKGWLSEKRKEVFSKNNLKS